MWADRLGIDKAAHWGIWLLNFSSTALFGGGAARPPLNRAGIIYVWGMPGLGAQSPLIIITQTIQDNHISV